MRAVDAGGGAMVSPAVVVDRWVACVEDHILEAVWKLGVDLIEVGAIYVLNGLRYMR